VPVGVNVITSFGVMSSVSVPLDDVVVPEYDGMVCP
jgi:hypothetical protein